MNDDDSLCTDYRTLYDAQTETPGKKYMEEVINSIVSGEFIKVIDKAACRNEKYLILRREYSKAGIGTEISPHKLRSAFCTILYDETKDINFVSQAVGHKNIETTQRYIVNDGQTKKKAVSLLDDIFSR